MRVSVCVVCVLAAVLWGNGGLGDVVVNYWTPISQCVGDFTGNNCPQFNDEDQNCRGRGGFEYANNTACVLPNFWNIFPNCLLYDGAVPTQKCTTFPTKTCEKTLKGFLIASNTYCVVPANYTHLSSLFTNFSTIPNCTIIPGNTQSCLLNGNWTVVSNCFDGVCSSDLQSHCNQSGGVYFTNSFISNDAVTPVLVNEPSCAFPFPAISVFLCESEDDTNSDGDLVCDAWSAEQCPGFLFNGGYSCLLEGNYTVVPDMYDPNSCTNHSGVYYNGQCLLNDTWTLVESSSRVNQTSCAAKGGISYLNGYGCALDGVWTVLSCFNSTPCNFTLDACNDASGFLISEGCVAPGRWAVNTQCWANQTCDDSEKCKWSQCKEAKGILYDNNCFCCAIPPRSRTYNSEVWKGLVAGIVALAALILIANFSTKVVLFCRRKFCRKVERY